MNFFPDFAPDSEIPERSDACRFSINFAKTISKIAEILKFVKIDNIQFYSILFNRVLNGKPSSRSAMQSARGGTICCSTEQSGASMAGRSARTMSARGHLGKSGCRFSSEDVCITETSMLSLQAARVSYEENI